MTPNVNCAFFEMPVSIKAYTISNDDLSFTVILNSRLTYEQHLASYKHELFHIFNGDYDMDSDIDFIELRAHAANTL